MSCALNARLSKPGSAISAEKLTNLCSGLRAQLNEMPKQFLRSQAVRLGLDDSGLKTDLVSGLVAHLTDQIGPDGLMALGPGAEPEARGEVRLMSPPLVPAQARGLITLVPVTCERSAALYELSP